MPTRQTVQFPHVDQQGGGANWKEQILKGLRLAALFTEPPKHRLLRQAEERRQRESQFGISADQERLAMARRRESRLERADEDAAKDKSLERALQLAQSGYKLSPEQVQGIDSGELLGLDLGSGVNTGIAGGTLIEHEGQNFFVPGRQAERELSQNSSLDALEEKARVEAELRDRYRDVSNNIPLSGDLESLRQYFPDADTISPEQLRALNTALDLIRDDPEYTDKLTFTDDTNTTSRVYIDPKTGKKKSIPLGKRAAPRVPAGESRRQSEAQAKKFVNTQVGKIKRSAKTFAEAQQQLQKLAETDKKVDEEYATIERELAEQFSKTSGGGKGSVRVEKFNAGTKDKPYWILQGTDPKTGEIIWERDLDANAPPPEPGFFDNSPFWQFFGVGEDLSGESDDSDALADEYLQQYGGR